jgi:integrase
MVHDGEEAATRTAPTSLPPRAASPPSRRPPALETMRLYAGDWAAFVTWCRNAQRSPLPAEPAVVTAYLGTLVGRLSHGALSRRVAAIVDQHRQQGFASPATDPTGKTILREARRSATPRRRPPPLAAQLARMAAACPGDLAGLRDRALLLLTAATGLGRTLLVGLDAEHVRLTAPGVELTIHYHHAGAGTARTIIVQRGASLATCPARALEDWLRSSDTSFGPVFRKVDRWGNVEHRRLGTDAIRRILARRSSRRIRRTEALTSP